MKKTVFFCMILSFAGHGYANDVSWSYKGKTGPDHWGDLSEAYQLCKNGQSQSPVNINESEVVLDKSLPEITFSYYSTPKTVLNTGKGIRVTAGRNNKLVFKRRVYNFKYLEFHLPAEHQLNNEPADMEAQFVHQNEAGDFLIVSTLFKVRQANSALAKLIDQLPKRGDPETIVKTPTTNTTCGIAPEIGACGLLPINKSYYYYPGSLTKPPCSEDVKWIIMKKRLSVSQKQLDALLEAAGGTNQRPIQPLNQRQIYTRDE